METEQQNTPQDDKAARRPVAKNHRFAVWPRLSTAKEREGEVEYTIKEHLKEGGDRYVSMRGQINGAVLTGEQVLQLMEGECVRIKGQTRGEKPKQFVREVCLREVNTVPASGEGRSDRHYANLGIASLRIGDKDGVPSVFGYSLNGRDKDNNPIKVRFLQEVKIGNGHVELTSADCWRLYDAGVGNPVNFKGEVELTLSKLEERRNEDNSVALFAYVDGIEIAKEVSEAESQAEQEGPEAEQEAAGVKV